MSAEKPRDHGGNLDAAIARFKGQRSEWLDLSTGINPVPYALPHLEADHWQALPDHNLSTALATAARRFWNVPDGGDFSGARRIIPDCTYPKPGRRNRANTRPNL